MGVFYQALLLAREGAKGKITFSPENTRFLFLYRSSLNRYVQREKLSVSLFFGSSDTVKVRQQTQKLAPLALGGIALDEVCEHEELEGSLHWGEGSKEGEREDAAHLQTSENNFALHLLSQEL